MVNDDIKCSLNYEAEYERVREKLAETTKAHEELLAELRSIYLELEWHKGYRAAVELLVGKVYS